MIAFTTLRLFTFGVMRLEGLAILVTHGALSMGHPPSERS